MKPSEKKTVLEPRELTALEPERQIGCARISPCGKYLFTGGYDALIRRWELTGEQPVELEPMEAHRGWITGLEFAGELVITADSWGAIAAWPYDEKKPRPRWRHEQAHDGWIRSLAVSGDGAMLATAGRDRMVRVWSATDGKRTHELKGHEHDVYSVAIHPDGQAVASGDLMGILKHWDLAKGECAREVTLEKMHFYERIQDVAGLRLLKFHEGGKALLCAGSDPTRAGRAYGIPTLRFLAWDSLEEQKAIHFGPDKNGFVFDVHWHPDGYFMLVTSGPPGAGQFLFVRPEDKEPCYMHKKMYNCHALAVHLESGRAVVAATNKQSQGNGAVLDKEGNYRGNTSPLHIFQLPERA